MHSPDTLATCPQEAAELQRAALLPRAAALLQLLVAGVVGALPSGRFMDLVDTLVDILVVSSLFVQCRGSALQSAAVLSLICMP